MSKNSKPMTPGEQMVWAAVFAQALGTSALNALAGVSEVPDMSLVQTAIDLASFAVESMRSTYREGAAVYETRSPYSEKLRQMLGVTTPYPDEEEVWVLMHQDVPEYDDGEASFWAFFVRDGKTYRFMAREIQEKKELREGEILLRMFRSEARRVGVEFAIVDHRPRRLAELEAQNV